MSKIGCNARYSDQNKDKSYWIWGISTNVWVPYALRAIKKLGSGWRLFGNNLPYLCLSGDAVSAYDLPDGVDLLEVGELRHHVLDGAAGGNCIKISFPGKSILRDYFQQNGTSQRPFLFLRISFPGRPISIQFIPAVGRWGPPWSRASARSAPPSRPTWGNGEM